MGATIDNLVAALTFLNDTRNRKAPRFMDSRSIMDELQEAQKHIKELRKFHQLKTPLPPDAVDHLMHLKNTLSEEIAKTELYLDSNKFRNKIKFRRRPKSSSIEYLSLLHQSISLILESAPIRRHYSDSQAQTEDSSNLDSKVSSEDAEDTKGDRQISEPPVIGTQGFEKQKSPWESMTIRLFMVSWAMLDEEGQSLDPNLDLALSQEEIKLDSVSRQLKHVLKYYSTLTGGVKNHDLLVGMYRTRHVQYCNRRVKDTCDWILDHPRYREWNDHKGRCALLWCYGRSGTGKSILT